MRGGKQAILVRGDQLEGPGVVGAAERVGERGVVDLALPHDAEARVEHLFVEALLVEEAHARVHVLPLLAVAEIAVEVADVESLLLLSIAHQDAHHLVDVAQLKRLAVGEHRRLATFRVADHLYRALAKGRIDIALEQIHRFHEMTVTIDRLHRLASAPVRARSNRPARPGFSPSRV